MPEQCLFTSIALWGSSECAEQRNLKNNCRGIRNSSNFLTDRRNSPSLADADILEK